LVVLRDKVIQPLLAGALGPAPKAGSVLPPTVIDEHYQVLRTGMQGLFKELGIAA
jgi:hypothetical protein